MKFWQGVTALAAVSLLAYLFFAQSLDKSTIEDAASQRAVTGMPANAPSETPHLLKEAASQDSEVQKARSDQASSDSNCVEPSQECADTESNDQASRIAREAQEQFLQEMLANALMNDPRTGSLVDVTEAERLQVFEQFSSEPLDPVWSADITNSFNAGIERAARIDRDIAPELIDCRSTSCMVRFPTDTDEDEVALLARVSVFTGTAGFVTRSEIHRSDQYADVYLTDIEPIGFPSD